MMMRRLGRVLFCAAALGIWLTGCAHVRGIWESPAAEPVALRVRADIDGSDILRVTPAGAAWFHVEWATPKDVTLNDVAWNPSEQPELPNEGATAFLPVAVDFASAELLPVAVRGSARIIHAGADCVMVLMVDPPAYGATYEFDLVFQPAR